MFGLGPLELGIIGFIAVLIFGPRQIPRLGRSIGSSIREFREAGRQLLGDDDETKS